MPSPFPGMDPYLERQGRWHPFHTRLVSTLADAIDAILPERYYVSVEERATIMVPEDSIAVGRPDVTVADLGGPRRGDRGGTATLAPAIEVTVPVPETLGERYLEVRDIEDTDEVVTVIEVLSPWNKRPGRGRADYLAKRDLVLASRTNLVEIDLLRSGARMPLFGGESPYDYGVLVSRGEMRPRAVLIPFTVRDRIPVFPLPLLPGDVEPLVELQAVFDQVYDRSRLSKRIDYERPPDPPLRPEDAAWATQFRLPNP